jgi:hypothetical protein
VKLFILLCLNSCRPAASSLSTFRTKIVRSYRYAFVVTLLVTIFSE